MVGVITVAKTNGGNGTYARATGANAGTCAIGSILPVGGTCTIGVTFTSPAGNSTTTGTVTVTGIAQGVAAPIYTATRNLTGA